MNSQNRFIPQNIVAVKIYLERRTTRSYVGELRKIKKNGKYVYHLQYDSQYLMKENSIPLGPELSLARHSYESPNLFPSFQDRIPSKENAAYVDYCRTMGISEKEQNPIVLLATIGKQGPSSFIFEPVFKDNFSAEKLKEYRQGLGLTIREFSDLFDVSASHLQKIEAKKSSGKEILKILKIYYDSPERLLSKVIYEGGMLHVDKRQELINILVNKIKEEIKAVYYSLQKQGNGVLSDWQTIKVRDAIEAFKSGFYNLTIVCLNLATINEEEVSKGVWHVKKIKKEAEDIDLEKIISEL